MGIDTIMLAATNQPITDDEMRNLSWKMGVAIGSGQFWGRRALVVTDSYQAKAGYAQTIEVSQGWRYYGPGYERGPFEVIYMAAVWLEHNIPGADVFYGGDSDDKTNPFGVEQRDQLLAHWLEHGHWPYRSGFGKCKGGYECEHCKKPMGNSGGSASVDYYTCAGCGWDIVKDKNTGRVEERERRR